MKGGEFLNQLSDHQLLEKEFDPRRQIFEKHLENRDAGQMTSH
jgi:hypothetical protein